MGNTAFVRDRRVCVKTIKKQIRSYTKIKPPTIFQGCRSFAAMVNFLSMFCPGLQKFLKPIYDISRKGRHNF